MGVVAYKKFFNVDVKHDFNKSGFTKDITITPTMETELKMRNSKMMLRPTPSGVRMFYRAVGSGIADTDSFVPIDNTVFTFALQLSNKAEFLNVTDLNETLGKEYQQGNIVRFWNDPATTLGLEYEIIDLLRPAAFVFNFTLANTAVGNVQVEVLDAGGGPVIPISDPLTAVNGVYSYKIDLSEEPKGKYQLVVTDDGDSNNDKTVLAYIDGDLSDKDIFGILEIDYPSTVTLADFVALGNFRMELKRRLSKWKYFIINKTERITPFDDTTAFTIEQLTPYENLPVYTGSPYLFGPAVVEEQPINGMDAVSIVSVAAIPFFEESIARLKLSVNASTLITNLPNPTRYTVSSDPTDYSITHIYVYV